MTRILGLLRPCSDLFSPSLAGGSRFSNKRALSRLKFRRGDQPPGAGRATLAPSPGPGLKSYFFNIEADRHSCSLVVDSIRGKRNTPPSEVKKTLAFFSSGEKKKKKRDAAENFPRPAFSQSANESGERRKRRKEEKEEEKKKRV